MKIVLITIGLIALLVAIAPALAAGPMQTLEARVNDFMRIMDDERYRDEAKKTEQRDEMWLVIKQTIFFQGVARLTVGKDWGKFQDGEKNEFTDAFAELLARSYLKTIQRKYGKERVVFLDEKIMTDRKAVVRTKVLHNGREVPVEVKMALVENEWRIYDAVVEGVSLIANYRAQFAEILLNKTPAYLIERIKNKLATGAVETPNLPE